MKFDHKGANALMDITSRPELVFTSGNGSWLFDHNGKRYLDFIQGWAVNSLGHCPPTVVKAIQDQAQTLLNPSPAFYNQGMMDLAKIIVENSCFDKVFFANSGAEANEGAIKLARKWGQKNKNGAFKIITFEHSFHGRTLATMSASGKAGWDTMFAPQVDGFVKAPLNNLDAVADLIDDETVAIMLEPIQGEGGVIPAESDFMQGLRKLSIDKNVLLIVDEVQTGMGRTGSLFAYELFGIKPDIMTLGKGIGAGVPLAALCATEAVSCFEYGDQGGTYNGNPLTSVAGLAVFNAMLEPGFMDMVNSRSNYLSQGLLKLSDKWNLKGERGIGLLRALVLDDDYGGEIVKAAMDASPDGLLLNAPRPNLLRFMPALNVSEEEIDLMLSMLDDLITQVKK